jgi:hypothetical protein
VIDASTLTRQTEGRVSPLESLMLMRPMLRQIGIALAAGAGLLLVVDGWAGSDAKIPSVTFPQAIYLDAPTLARLAVTNPNHFARAERILAAANYLCRPRVPDVYLASFGAQDLSCEPMVLLTSNPPQWRIGFRLDETRYVAAVWITDDPPRTMPVR